MGALGALACKNGVAAQTACQKDFFDKQERPRRRWGAPVQERGRLRKFLSPPADGGAHCRAEGDGRADGEQAHGDGGGTGEHRQKHQRRHAQQQDGEDEPPEGPPAEKQAQKAAFAGGGIEVKDHDAALMEGEQQRQRHARAEAKARADGGIAVGKYVAHDAGEQREEHKAEGHRPQEFSLRAVVHFRHHAMPLPARLRRAAARTAAA